MNVSFSGKVALVVGGTGGLGRAVSLGFLAEGAQVVATYRNEDEFAALQGTAWMSPMKLLLLN
jgi:NAD(P)-dependent dehydrogenase (short-subunit alcohol dehydrogenase family)